MQKRRIILLNIIFIMVTVFFLILSLILNFLYFIPFFFLPIICWLPFIFKGRKRALEDYESYYKPYDQAQKDEGRELVIRQCPVCGGQIVQPIAKFCYHCGAKLNND